MNGLIGIGMSSFNRFTLNILIAMDKRIDISKIGIGMVTYNAEHRIRQSAFTVPKWIKTFVIVNDGTPYSTDAYPEHSHVIQHDKNRCVAAAKNTALSYLMKQGCEHIFLMEDDILIKDESVFEAYILNSMATGIRHYNFALHGPANKANVKGFSTLEDRKDVDGEPNPRLVVEYGDGTVLYMYPNCVGAFSYYHRSVIEKIGYFDTKYKNAWEHVDHTVMAIKHWMHPPFWYFADIDESWKYLSDIPGSIDNSTILGRGDCNINIRNGMSHFKSKHKVYPGEIKLKSEEEVLSVLTRISKSNN